jgi:hypothetical protein
LRGQKKIENKKKMCPNKMKIQHTKNLEREKEGKKIYFQVRRAAETVNESGGKGGNQDERREAKERGKTGGVCSRGRCGAVCRGRARVSPSLFFLSFLFFSLGFSVGFSSEMWSNPSLSC